MNDSQLPLASYNNKVDPKRLRHAPMRRRCHGFAMTNRKHSDSVICANSGPRASVLRRNKKLTQLPLLPLQLYYFVRQHTFGYCAMMNLYLPTMLSVEKT